MITERWAHQFAEEWIAAWNAHDLERIFSHYAEDFEMHSPLIVERMGVPSGILKGKDAIRPYWAQGLAAQPPLHFTLRDVLIGVDTLAIYYFSKNRNRMVAEIMVFNEHGYAIRGTGLYSREAT